MTSTLPCLVLIERLRVLAVKGIELEATNVYFSRIKLLKVAAVIMRNTQYLASC